MPDQPDAGQEDRPCKKRRLNIRGWLKGGMMSQTSTMSPREARELGRKSEEVDPDLPTDVTDDPKKPWGTENRP